jgi:hypothetical protein
LLNNGTTAPSEADELLELFAAELDSIELLLEDEDSFDDDKKLEIFELEILLIITTLVAEELRNEDELVVDVLLAMSVTELFARELFNTELFIAELFIAELIATELLTAFDDAVPLFSPVDPPPQATRPNKLILKTIPRAPDCRHIASVVNKGNSII